MTLMTADVTEVLCIDGRKGIPLPALLLTGKLYEGQTATAYSPQTFFSWICERQTASLSPQRQWMLM